MISISFLFVKTFESKKNAVKKENSFLNFIKLFSEIFMIILKKNKGDDFMGSILETVMLVCFGFSWPLNVIKAYRAKTAKGTSLPFILLIIMGYVAGISAKLISGKINYVLIAYVLNLAIVSLNLLVYFRNASLDKKRLQGMEI